MVLAWRRAALMGSGACGPSLVQGQSPWPSSFLCSAAIVLAALAWIRFSPLDLSRAHDLSLELQDHAGETLNVAVAHDGMWRLRTQPQDVSPAYLAMLLRMEDQRFY